MKIEFNRLGHVQLRIPFGLKGAEAAARANVETLTGETLATFNSFATPEAVGVRRWTLRGRPGFVVEPPQHSVSVITLDVK